MASIDEIELMFKKHLEPVLETLSEIKEESKTTKEKYEKLEQHVGKIENEMEYLKSEIIKKNLILFGLPEKNNEVLEEEILKFFKEQLQQKDMSIWEISDAQRMGKKNNFPRGVKVELTTKTRKMKILEKTKLLRGTAYRLLPEFTKKVIEDRKVLKPYMIEAREKGLRSHLVYNKIKIGEQIYTKEEITAESVMETMEIASKNIKGKDLKYKKSWTDSEEEDGTSYRTPRSFKTKNNQETAVTESKTGAIPKRKDISPLITSQPEDNLRGQVQKLREEEISRKRHKQQTINSLFRRGT